MHWSLWTGANSGSARSSEARKAFFQKIPAQLWLSKQRMLKVRGKLNEAIIAEHAGSAGELGKQSAFMGLFPKSS